MKYKLIPILIFTLFLFSCGGSSSVSTAISTSSETGISNSTGAKGTYTLSASGLSGKEVYALINNDNLSSSTTVTPSITGISSSVLLEKNSTVSKSNINRIDVDEKFFKNKPNLVKGEKLATSKSTTVSKSYTVGSSTTFYTTLTDNSSSGTSDQDATITATLMAENIGTRTINIWVDNNYKSSIRSDYITNLVNIFYSSTNPKNIYSNITNIYGDEWGSNSYSNLIGSTDTIDILLTPLNRYYGSSTNTSTSTSANGYVMGYFAPIDTFTTSYVTTNYSGHHTNERNMFYLDAELFGKQVSSMTDTQKTYYHNDIYSTLAHEFTHMIMWYQKYVLDGADSDTWLNEMLAMISEDLMDDKINSVMSSLSSSESGIIEGSKSRIDEFNVKYNNIPVIIGSSSSYKLENYASDGVFGLYLTRAYGRSNLDFLKKIMHSTYVGYDAIEYATGDKFSTILQCYAKALMISSDNTISNTKYNMNKTFYTVYGSYTYNFEPINIFDTLSYSTFTELTSGIEGSAMSLRKLKSITGSTGNWTFIIPSDNMPFQIVVKNSDGSFDATTSATLNSAISKN